MQKPVSKYHLSLLFLSLLIFSCQKWEDKPAQDLGLTNKYCNDPVAVNYNHGFPGVPDNSVCVYPAQVFEGTYGFRDSIFFPDNSFRLGDSIVFTVTSVNKQKLAFNGFCDANQLFFLADRYYKAISDTVIGKSQLMCRSVDTLSGNLTKNILDSTISINFTVVSDTDITYHRGTAYKH